MIYASTEDIKCFECGDLGHKVSHKYDQRRGDVHNVNQPQKHTEKQRTEMQEKAATEEVSVINLNAGRFVFLRL